MPRTKCLRFSEGSNEDARRFFFAGFDGSNAAIDRLLAGDMKLTIVRKIFRVTKKGLNRARPETEQPQRLSEEEVNAGT